MLPPDDDTSGDGKELRHGNTYIGHASAGAAALANFAIVQQEDSPEDTRRVGRHLLEGLSRLERHDIAGDVRGIGLLARNDVLTLSPALILTAEQADEIVAVVDQAITKFSQHL